MSTPLRPMSTSELLDRTFSLYRNNFVLFAGIAILPPAMKLVLDILQWPTTMRALSGNGMFSIGATRGQLTGGEIGGSLLLFLVYMFGAIVASAAAVYAVSMVYLGKNATISGSYKGIGARIPRLIGIFLLMFIMFLGGGLVLAFPMGAAIRSGSVLLFLLLLLVGLVLLVHLYACISLATAVCVVEKAGVLDSLNRSMALTKGSRGRIWLVFLLTFVMNLALGFAVGIPAGFIGVATHSALSAAILLVVGQFLVSTLVAPILIVPLVLIYYDQRVRKEAFDLQLMMEAIGQNPDQAAAASIG